MKDLRMYILVNKEIEISKAKLSGQVGHAVNVYIYNILNNYIVNIIENKEKYNNTDIINKNLLDEYMAGSIKKIILSCTQKKMEDLEKLGYVTIRDNGLTELEPNTLTCITVGILDKNNIPDDLKFIKRLRLL